MLDITTIPTGTFAEFFDDIFMTPGRSEQGFYFDHLASWFAHLDNSSILFLNFEDMVEDLKREVTKVANFLKLDCGEEKIDAVVNSSTFASMTKNPNVNYSWRDGSKKNPGSRFLRKGKVGGWMDELTEEQSERLDKLCKERIEAPFGIKIRSTL